MSNATNNANTNTNTNLGTFNVAFKKTWYKNKTTAQILQLIKAETGIKTNQIKFFDLVESGIRYRGWEDLKGNLVCTIIQ